MDAYIYRADVYCAECAEWIKMRLQADLHEAGEDFTPIPEDSDEWPQGPYADGGGEADCPQHCGGCGKFLENPLTLDGYAYVRGCLDAYVGPDDHGIGPDMLAMLVADRIGDDERPSPALAQWATFYPETWEPSNGYTTEAA